jgi:hypothetical protein
VSPAALALRLPVMNGVGNMVRSFRGWGGGGSAKAADPPGVSDLLGSAALGEAGQDAVPGVEPHPFAAATGATGCRYPTFLASVLVYFSGPMPNRPRR